MSSMVPDYLSFEDGGRSRYENEARDLAERYRADAVLVIVIGGSRGTGSTLKLRATQVHSIKVQLSTYLVRWASILNPDGVD